MQVGLNRVGLGVLFPDNWAPKGTPFFLKPMFLLVSYGSIVRLAEKHFDVFGDLAKMSLVDILVSATTGQDEPNQGIGFTRQAGGRRLAGQGPLLEEMQRRTGNRMTSARAGIIGAVIVVGGTLAYHNALEQQEQIREIILHRYQEGQVTDEQYRDVFGERSNPDYLKKYWSLLG